MKIKVDFRAIVMMMIAAVAFIAAADSRLYMVIDLEKSGKSAISYLSEAPKGGWGNEYKTTKLVMRKILPGSFEYMPGKSFKLTKPYYIGVFEVTQKQYELVVGCNPSKYIGEMRPVEMVRYVDIRGRDKGLNWPNDDEVDETSFLGRLRSQTWIRFDLPTEVQWEYACRAGTKGDFNVEGVNSAAFVNCKDYGGDKRKHVVVGSFLPNAWGLYEMHGNVWEWCRDCGPEGAGSLDWTDDAKETDIDPKGSTAGISRITRSGGFWSAASSCRSGRRCREDGLAHRVEACGFRLYCPVPASNSAQINDNSSWTVVPLQSSINEAKKLAVELCMDDVNALKAGKITHEELANKFVEYADGTEKIAMKLVLIRNAFYYLVIDKKCDSANDLFNKTMVEYGAPFALAISEYGRPSLVKQKGASGVDLLSKIDEVKKCLENINEANKNITKSIQVEKNYRNLAYNSVKIGDWKTALCAYVKSGGEIGKVAKWELKEEFDGSNSFSAESVADFWWKMIDGKDKDKLWHDTVAEHAAYWYQTALGEGKMSELKQRLAKKRIESLSQVIDNAESSENGAVATSLILLPVNKANGYECSYTFEKPIGSWKSTWFDDSRWSKARMYITSNGVWKRSDIWIRAKFDCDFNVNQIKQVILQCIIDEDVEVWINDIAVYEHNGYHRDIWNIPLRADLFRSLRRKDNVIAIHGRNRHGYGRVDIGLKAEFKK